MASLDSSPMEKHQKLYKTNGSPHWKDSYRKRCQDRLKKSRDSFLLRFRQIGYEEKDHHSVVEELMADEWKSMQEQDPSLSDQGDASGLSIDDALSVLEEIKAELLQEEQRLLHEVLHYDEGMIAAAINNLSTEHVICPLCQKSILVMNRGVILCTCGLRLDTEQDAITLEDVHENIAFGTRQHSAVCDKNPRFSIFNPVGVDSLIMTCEACDFMFIIV